MLRTLWNITTKAALLMAVLVSVLLSACNREDDLALESRQSGQLNVSEAAPGDLVTITGISFDTSKDKVDVFFAGQMAKIVSFGDNQIVTEVPAKATSGHVEVRVNNISYSVENFFQIILNRIRPTYWIEQSGAEYKIVKGVADLGGNTTKTVLFVTQTPVVSVCLEPITNSMYWVEQELDFTTFMVASSVYRANLGIFKPSTIDTIVSAREVITSITVSLADNKLFWTELPNTGNSGTLFQADVNGQNISALYSSSMVTNPSSLKYEETDNNLYFVANSRNIIKAAANGSSITTLYTGSSTRRLGGIAVDKASNKLFVSNLGLPADESDLIQYGSLDGTATLTTLVVAIPGENNPVINTTSLDVDRIGNFLYWLNSGTTDNASGSIYRLKLEGSSNPQLIFDGISIAGSVDVRARKKAEVFNGTISLQ